MLFVGPAGIVYRQPGHAPPIQNFGIVVVNDVAVGQSSFSQDSDLVIIVYLTRSSLGRCPSHLTPIRWDQRHCYNCTHCCRQY